MRPNKLFLFTLLFFILVFGCSAPGAIATPAPATVQLPATLEQPPAPLSTPAATFVSSTPSSTSSANPPPLTTRGPYLAYQVQTGDQTFIKFLDADGSGQASFSYPDHAAPENFRDRYPIPSRLMENGWPGTAVLPGLVWAKWAQRPPT